MSDEGSRIAIVGPCASGKSTLVSRLHTIGIEARMPAQEHSYVPDMWSQLVQPDLLVYLDADNATLRRRRPSLTDEYLERERERLAHAREHADLTIDTSKLTPDEVLARVQGWLNNKQ